jgi:predicted nucleotide-binding protein
MKAAFVVNARDKAALVARAVNGALSQTYPCHILLSDQSSTDGTYEVMEKAVAENGETHHKVDLLRCPIDGEYGMRACNKHMQWLVERTDCEWIFQCSADDYSLPERVRVCMQAVDELARSGRKCDAIGNTMRFEAPGRQENGALSGYPTETGYVSAGLGLFRMAYGSCIWGYRRDFLLKVGLDVQCTLDVYLGYLAAVGNGCYVVANPQHVHYMAEDLKNMGFQGKMRAAEKAGDAAQIAQINELNRFQLFELYFQTKVRQQEIFPLAHADDQNALVNMMLQQAVGWYIERSNLHKKGISPCSM